MNKALRIAASGMYAQQLNVDLIANNLSNVNTTAFKKSRPEFQDLMYQTLKSSTQSQDRYIQQPVEIEVGNGTVPVATVKDFSQGDITTTSSSLDIAINGEGFFQIQRTDGTIAYSRDGSFKESSEGTIVTSQGYALEPGLSLPSNTTAVTIGTDGTVEATVSGETSTVKVGQIELAKFVNAAGLKSIGNNLYTETAASGKPILGTGGTDGFGTLQQKSLEASNVDVVSEMVSMITAQRAYEINSKSIQTVDDMLSLTDNLKRS
jgi:flagellar basal-body rod protein FlgG